MGTLRYEDREIVINNNETGEITQKLYDVYTGIQNGTLDDKMVGESLYQNINKIEYDHENKM